LSELLHVLPERSKLSRYVAASKRTAGLVVGPFPHSGFVTPFCAGAESPLLPWIATFTFS